MNERTLTIPHDVGAERAVLGAVFLSPDVVLDHAERAKLTHKGFYREAHRLLWKVFKHLEGKQEPIDLVTVAGRLEAINKLETIGGYPYLAGLPASTPSIANSPHYIKEVLDKATLRRLLTLAAETTESIHQGELSADDVRARLEGAVFDIGEEREEGTGLERISTVMERYNAALRERAAAPNDIGGISTGFHDLDRKLGGLNKTNLIILAARPAMGKSALALDIVRHAALRERAKVAVFALEMSKEQNAGRMVSSEGRVSGHRLRTGRLHDDDWSPYLQAMEDLHGAPVWLDDTAGQTLAQIWGKCRRMKAKDGLDLAVIDYLQLMSGTGKEGNREQVISGITRGLKCMAKDLDIPVIALSQLNRGVESRADKRPLMSDLRESGAIEQDADEIMFLYRDEVYNEHTEMKGVAEVLIRKNRHGDIGDVKLFWRGEYTRFENLARNDL